MKTLKKLLVVASMLSIVVTVLAGCGEDPVLAYNVQVSEAYSATNNAVGKMFDDLYTALDKDGKTDIAVLDTIVSGGTKAAREGVAALRALTPPDAPGVKEFDASLKLFVSGVEEALVLTGQSYEAAKVGDKAKLSDTEQKLKATFEKVSKLEDAVIAAQEEMAKKNNISLE